jgi:hypothetical protein
LKKVAPIFILIIFLFNSMGYYFLFEVNRAMVKREMSARLKRDGVKLTILSIADPSKDQNFKRIESREILYHGKMYDVLKEVRREGVTLFYCIHDEKEQNLLAGFKKVSHSKLSQFLADHLIKNALPVSGKICAPAMEGLIRYPLLKNKTCSINHLPATPPPECS